MIEHSELEKFLSNAAQASAVNGATIVDAEGMVRTGLTVVAVQGTSLNGYKHLAITAKNKSGSVSSLTFTFIEVNQGITNSTKVTLASLRVAPGNTGYAYVSTALAGLSDTLTIEVTADPESTPGEDSEHITVTGYTS